MWVQNHGVNAGPPQLSGDMSSCRTSGCVPKVCSWEEAFSDRCLKCVCLVCSWQACAGYWANRFVLRDFTSLEWFSAGQDAQLNPLWVLDLSD